MLGRERFVEELDDIDLGLAVVEPGEVGRTSWPFFPLNRCSKQALDEREDGLPKGQSWTAGLVLTNTSTKSRCTLINTSEEEHLSRASCYIYFYKKPTTLD